MTIKKRTDRGNWIQTFTGKRFYPLAPLPEDICIEDIAHSLSNKCRFTGHVTEYYSVAQHSVLVSRAVPQEDRLWGLMHDASEAYLADLAKPTKVLPEFKFFVEIEDRIQLVVCEKFGLSPIQPPSTHLADKRALMAEKRDLMIHIPESEWQIQHPGVIPLEEKIVSMLPQEAEQFFLNEFKKLTEFH